MYLCQCLTQDHVVCPLIFSGLIKRRGSLGVMLLHAFLESFLCPGQCSGLHSPVFDPCRSVLERLGTTFKLRAVLYVYVFCVIVGIIDGEAGQNLLCWKQGRIARVLKFRINVHILIEKTCATRQ